MRGYWSSPDGLRRQRRDRWLRTMRALVEQEPQAKGRGGTRHAHDFRAAVRAEIDPDPSWPRLRASLAVDLHCTTTRRQPPSLERLPKNYLDLLGATHAPPGDPGPVLYRDDRAIAMLFARCDHRWDPDEPAQRPSIHVQARSRADALADLALAGDVILASDDNQEEGTWRAGVSWPAWAEEDEYRWLRAAARLGDRHADLLADALRHRIRQHAQDTELAGNDNALRSAFFCYPQLLLTGTDPDQRRLERLGDSAAGTDAAALVRTRLTDARRMIRFLSTIPLPPLPAAPGDTAAFKAGLDSTLQRLVDDRPGLFPLLVPLRVTVLVIPPAQQSGVTDLDNLLIPIVAAVNTHLRPPLEPGLLGPDLGDLSSEDPDGPVPVRNWQRRARARLKSLGEAALWSYQVLRLHRQPDDPGRGAVRLLLGHGENPRSMWEEADDYLRDHFDDE